MGKRETSFYAVEEIDKILKKERKKIDNKRKGKQAREMYRYILDQKKKIKWKNCFGIC